MVWVAVSSFGGSIIHIPPPKTRLDSEQYQHLIQKNYVPFFQQTKKELPEYEWAFLQDNPTPHVSKSTKKFFECEKIPLLQFPPNSPDLNVIENVWSYFVPEIYKEGRKYQNLAVLRWAITSTWEKMPHSIVQDLVNTMEHRLIEVIQKGGKITKY